MNTRKVARFVGIHEIPLAIALGLVLCAGASWLLWHQAFNRGRDSEKLEQLAKQKVSADRKIAVDTRKVVEAKTVSAGAVAKAAVLEKKSQQLANARAIVRGKITLVGDTATTPSGTQILLPEIAEFIRISDASHSADSATRSQDTTTIAALSTTIVHMDTLTVDHIKREKIDDQQTRILEREKRPRFGIKTGIAIGVTAAIAIVKAASLILK